MASRSARNRQGDRRSAASVQSEKELGGNSGCTIINSRNKGRRRAGKTKRFLFQGAPELSTAAFIIRVKPLNTPNSRYCAACACDEVSYYVQARLSGQLSSSRGVLAEASLPLRIAKDGHVGDAGRPG